jgi:hypothetical protein
MQKHQQQQQQQQPRPMTEGPVLPDGTYDAFVLDATRDGEVLHLELTIIAGRHKGEVLTLSATGLDRDELDLMGVPATIAVDGGRPAVTIEG